MRSPPLALARASQEVTTIMLSFPTRRFGGAVLAALVLVQVSASAQPARHVEVYAHRGARAFSPENTLPSFKTALRIGADWVDMDVVLTKENEVLVSHDPVLNPDISRDERGEFLAQSREALAKRPLAERVEYDRKYAVRSLTLKELARFDVGRLNPASGYAKFFPDQLPVDSTRMPTLREAVRLAEQLTGKKIRFQIEMKTDPSRPDISPPLEVFAAAVYKVLKEEGIVDRVEVHAFDFRCLFELQKLDPRLKTAYLTSRDNEPGGCGQLLRPGPEDRWPLDGRQAREGIRWFDPGDGQGSGRIRLGSGGR